jgi:four helix bundle protein
MEDGREQQKKDLKVRTKEFALLIIRLYSSLSKATVAQVLGKQLLRSGTSVGAHYYEAQRAKSNADFISKIEGALQELDETTYWLELLESSGFITTEKLNSINKEINELISIFVSIVKAVKSRSKSDTQKQ